MKISRFTVLGQCHMDLTYMEWILHTRKGCAGIRCNYVVEGLQKNLPELSAITLFNLAAQIEEILPTAEDILTRFPPVFEGQVFEGLGRLGEEYEIKPIPDALLYSLFTPHHVPLPMKTKVTEELACLEAMGVISEVDQLTPWCAGMHMMVVPKLWIYPHLRQLETA